MSSIKFLSISPVCPYDSIGHAGGKTYNFYLKGINLCHHSSVSVLFFAPKHELVKCDLSSYGIPYNCIFTSGNFAVNVKHFVLDSIGYALFQNKMFSLYKLIETMRYLKLLQEKHDLPDVIELEWTNFAYFAKYIKRKYPTVKLIASEHDVSYQAYQRKRVSPQTLKRVKRQELDALAQCDLILVQSEKDRNILIQDGLSNPVLVISPYYHNMGQIKRKSRNCDILFWGAMYRPENYEAALWFIEYVMPLLSDIPVRFVVAGNRPPEQLKKYANERIVITGFVEDEKPLFESSMCFVSPLLTGAGIKVKVIEALSAGIPILTNTIGIEGIPAKDGESYFHCETPEEYANVIYKLCLHQIDVTSIEASQRLLVGEHFDLNASLKTYCNAILD